LEFLEGWFSENGYQCTSVNTTAAAAAELSRGDYSLVMAREALLGSYELVSCASRLEGRCGLLVYSADCCSVADQDHGPLAFIQQPFEAEGLRAVVLMALKRLRESAGLHDDREYLLTLIEDNSILLARLGELHRIQDRNEALTAAIEILARYFEVVHHQVQIYDPLKGRYQQLIASSEALEDPMFKVDDEELDFVVKNRGAALIPVEGPHQEAFLASGIRSVLHIPLSTHSRVTGVMLLYVSSDEFSSRAGLEAAVHVGQALTSTLEKIRLHTNLRAQSDLMDSVMESIPHGIIAIDLNDRILSINRNAENMFDIRRFLVLKEEFREVMPASLAAVFSTLSLMALKGRGAANYELLDHAIDGETLPIGISASCLYDREGQQSGVLYLCRDLLLSREVEKLRDLDALKSSFVHTVSHELKTPLTAILGGAEILLYDESLDDDTREIVEIVEEGGQRLKRLITDLLDLSTLESGQVDLNEDQHGLGKMIKETMDLLANRGNCELAHDWPEDLPHIIFDRAKLTQVMENLISNAIKYSPDGGTVTVTIEITDDNHQQVAVRDQGLGIPEDQREQVFDKFFRVDSSSTAEIEGTGLGLSITKHIIEMHGGEIWVESTLGEGSAFIFKLPIRQEQHHGF